MTTPFTMSIEYAPGESKQHGFNIGTDEALARTIVADLFHARVRAGLPVIAVALMRDGKLVDCYDNVWASFSAS
jgi:hypothetical protein